MANNNKNKIYIIVTGVVAITLIWLSQSNNNKNKIPVPESSPKENIENKTAKEEPTKTFEGTLWSSGDEGKGNLMLTNGDTVIYIRTSRDFSNLIGKYVIVSIDGTLESFTLLNIEKNLTRDGYIQTN